MFKPLLTVLAILSLISCKTVSTVIETPVDNFPVTPKLEKYIVPPIIEKVGDDYRVTSQFVYNSVLLKEYNDKIEEWKTRYNVK